MKLSNKIRVTGKYGSKSKFDFWKNLKVGDVVEISTEIERIYRGRNGLSTTDVTCICGEMKFVTSMTMIAQYLSNLPHEEISV